MRAASSFRRASPPRPPASIAACLRSGLRLDLDGLAVKQRSQGHHGRIGQRWQFNEGVDGVRLDSHQLGTAFRYTTDTTLSAAFRITGAQDHRHRQHQEENKDSRLHGLTGFRSSVSAQRFRG